MRGLLDSCIISIILFDHQLSSSAICMSVIKLFANIAKEIISQILHGCFPYLEEKIDIVDCACMAIIIMVLKALRTPSQHLTSF